MYVGVTRARHTLMVSALKRRKRGRETVPALPSRFIAEMKLDEAVTREDPRERLKRRARRTWRSAAPRRRCLRHDEPLAEPAPAQRLDRGQRAAGDRRRRRGRSTRACWPFVFKPLTTVLIIVRAWAARRRRARRAPRGATRPAAVAAG